MSAERDWEELSRRMAAFVAAVESQLLPALAALSAAVERAASAARTVSARALDRVRS